MAGTQFTVDDIETGGFYVTVSDSLTVYESYADAVAEIQTKLSTDAESFLAEVAIEAEGDEDVAVTVEQVGWQQVIRDLAEVADEHDRDEEVTPSHD